MDNNSESIGSKLEELKELVECCPQGHNLLNLNCPFRNIRKLDDNNLEKVLCQMTIEEVEEIVDYHQACRAVEARPH